jgi:hypothetical protein
MHHCNYRLINRLMHHYNYTLEKIYNQGYE